jgi:superfamily II DNA or RNA helicase
LAGVALGGWFGGGQSDEYAFFDYDGEGFDDALLDTLFLTMPISWRGTLAQYAGRLQRLHAAKREVVIYDYVDEQEPVLAKMAAKREAGYKALGYEVTHAGELFSRKAGVPKGKGC